MRLSFSQRAEAAKEKRALLFGPMIFIDRAAARYKRCRSCLPWRLCVDTTQQLGPVVDADNGSGCVLRPLKISAPSDPVVYPLYLFVEDLSRRAYASIVVHYYRTR